jgi:exodeoxyribonuclease VII large subunit
MWRNDVLQLDKLPNNGDAVEVHGSISVYEAAGQYQLYADEIRPIGQGFLFQKFLELKEKLEKEGLFDKTHKRQIPYFPHVIGIVTSTTGAAIQDILRTITRRYPLTHIVIAPTQVQGEDAPSGIINAIKNLNEKVHPDVIILARGGGAIEDLWAFNDENVARAIFSSKAPVITGVGHETDFTIADFVSDLRSPTPTAAAELAVPNREDLKSTTVGYQIQLAQLLASKLTIEKQHTNNLINVLHQLSPQNYVRYGRQKLDEYIRRMNLSIRHKLIFEKSNIENIKLQINVLNPLAILDRGYAIVTTADNQIVHSVKHIMLGEQLTIRVSDGKFNANVKEIES